MKVHPQCQIPCSVQLALGLQLIAVHADLWYFGYFGRYGPGRDLSKLDCLVQDVDLLTLSVDIFELGHDCVF